MIEEQQTVCMLATAAKLQVASPAEVVEWDGGRAGLSAPFAFLPSL
jgi:hypothetical protein